MSSNAASVDRAVRTGPVLFIMILGTFLTTLNQTVMSVAIPILMNHFDITASTAQWLTTGYMLVNGVLIPITAYLMRRFTTRELFLTSMLLFLAGTILSAVATSFPVLLSGRLIQAAGGGIMMPLLTNVVFSIYPPEKRGAAMGQVGFAVLFAPAIGPTVAGYLLEHFRWESLFYSMIPLTILVIACAFFYLKNVSERMYPKIDFSSVVLSTVGFGALLYGFSSAGTAGWSSAEVLVSLAAGIVALALFVWRQLTSQDPLLDLRVFKDRMFSLTAIINIAVTMAMFADMILLPLYLQNARGFTAIESGLLLLPGALVMGFLMPVTGKLFDRYGARWLAIIGIIIMLVTTIGFVDLTDSTSYFALILLATGRRIGMAFVLQPIQTAGLNQLPSKLIAHGTAVSNTVRQVSGAIGTSLLVTVMMNRSTTHFQDMAAAGDLARYSQQDLMIEASIQGINDTYLVLIGFGIVGLVLSFFIKQVGKAKLKEEVAR